MQVIGRIGNASWLGGKASEKAAGDALPLMLGEFHLIYITNFEEYKCMLFTEIILSEIIIFIVNLHQDFEILIWCFSFKKKYE